jgi:hypothetical protein
MESVLSPIVNLIFENKLDVDDREPVLSFVLGDQKWGLFAPSILFWIQLLVAVTMVSAFFSALIATLVYTFIIPNRGSLFSYIFGFGFIIPLCIGYLPFRLMDMLDVTNKMMRFSIAVIYPVLTMFKTSEAMFGFSPSSVEASYRNYILYYVAAVEIEFDKLNHRPIKSTMDDMISALHSFAYNIILLGAVKSLFAPSMYEPFDTDANGNDEGYNVNDLFDFNLLRNNVISTALLQLYLSTFIGALCALVAVVLRVKVKDGMKNPLFQASSPSDFWSRRWNLIVHGVLKRGVFKPVYKYSSKFVALLATFLASGLFHEFILIAIHPSHLNFKPALGKNTAFMMWNAGIIVLESYIGGARVFVWIKNNLPKPIVTILVLCTAMPVAHWFLHPYTKSDVFQIHGAICAPMIKLMEEN